MGIKIARIPRSRAKKEVKKYQQRAKKNRVFWTSLSFLVILLRLVTPFLIFFYPLLGFLAILVTDDLDFVPLVKSGVSFKHYNYIDKPVDFFVYIVMASFWFGNPLFNIFLILLVIRFIGTLGFLLKFDRRFLVFFPNLIEPLFLGTILVLKYNFNLTLVLITLTTLKVLQEIYLYYSDNLRPAMRILKINIGILKTEIILNEVL